MCVVFQMFCVVAQAAPARCDHILKTKSGKKPMISYVSSLFNPILTKTKYVIAGFFVKILPMV